MLCELYVSLQVCRVYFSYRILYFMCLTSLNSFIDMVSVYQNIESISFFFLSFFYMQLNVQPRWCDGKRVRLAIKMRRNGYRVRLAIKRLRVRYPAGTYV